MVHHPQKVTNFAVVKRFKSQKPRIRTDLMAILSLTEEMKSYFGS